MKATQQTRSTALSRFPAYDLPALSALLAITAGLALRLWMLKKFFEVNGDSLIYGGLAKNLLLHGQYTLTVASGESYPTLIRLPGYPLFLAACFRVFGMENYVAVCWVEIALELAGCLLLADFARRIAPSTLRRAATHSTLWLAALCPFTASYAAAPLTEAPTLFSIALALWAAARFRERPGWGSALWFTFAVTFAALLRPDGALLAVALVPALVFGLWRMKAAGLIDPATQYCQGAPSFSAPFAEKGGKAMPLSSCRINSTHIDQAKSTGTSAPEGGTSQPFRPGTPSPAAIARMALVCTLLALAPFAAWTARNWRVFHVFQPLAPRLATDPGEDTHPGWERWVKTWCLDFVSTYNVYWNVPGGPLDLSELPARAFDSPAQYAETASLAAEYNDSGQLLTRELDAHFGKLADQRIAAHPLRFHLWLPLGRMADMWLRPRVENLPIDLDWWVYAHHHVETRFSWAYAGLNALFLLLGIAGLCLRPRFWGAMLAYFLLRSALLTTVQAPEARYTLECFPMLFVLGGIAIAWARQRMISLRPSKATFIPTK